MKLGKATGEKIKAIEDNDKGGEAVGNLTKPRMAAMLVMYGNTIRVQRTKENFLLDCIVALNALGVINNGTVV